MRRPLIKKYSRRGDAANYSFLPAFGSAVRRYLDIQGYDCMKLFRADCRAALERPINKISSPKSPLSLSIDIGHKVYICPLFIPKILPEFTYYLDDIAHS